MTATFSQSTRATQVTASEPAASGAVVFDTQLGWTAFAWNSHPATGEYPASSWLSNLTFGHAGQAKALDRLRDAWQEDTQDQEFPEVVEWSLFDRDSWQVELVHAVRAYAEGREVSFQCVPLDLASRSEFESAVIEGCRRIGHGQTLTYGELAEVAGSPRAARAVGNVMRKNRYPLIVPCHRVVGSAGKLGGYSAPSGLTMKRRLLELEST